MINPFEAANTPQARPRCTVAKILDELDPERTGYLQEALARPHILHRTLANVLTDWGHPISLETVSRHRRGDCRCERES